MRALLDDSAVIEYDDLIGIHDRLQPVCDHKHSFILHKCVNRPLDQHLIFGIKACGCLIEKNDRRMRPIFSMSFMRSS